MGWVGMSLAGQPQRASEALRGVCEYCGGWGKEEKSFNLTN